ncbi:MAG: LysR family transcriptional regulator [Clostridia bacterium]|nr:LysR family transcriptional regulator [Clostridia bacterium]
MNINQLEYFVAAAEMLNFTRAAERCHISQTAMTQQIHSLENTLGVPLFIRTSHHVELTSAGRVFLQEAKSIIEKSNEAVRLARLASEGDSGELTIGFINGYGHTEFAELLRSFHLAYPNIQIRFIRNNLSILQNMLSSGECDLIFAVAPYENRFPEFESTYLGSYPVMGVLPSNHPLASKESLTYQELENEKFIMMQPSTRAKEQMEESFLIYKRGGYFPEVVGMVGEPETLLLMISTGLGVSILPEYITRPYLPNKLIKVLPMVKSDGQAETIDFEMCRSTNNHNPAAERFLGLLMGTKQ